MHKMHIFLQKGGIMVSSWIAMIRPKWIHPQTHRLWITLAVDDEISPKSAFEALWKKVMHRISTRIGTLSCQNDRVYMSEYGRQ
jgi:hypothetical protein